MKVSELAAQSGVTVSTVKYYLRAGLVHPGEQVTATTALYDDTHVARIRLVRALVDGVGMSIADVQRVVGVLDGPVGSWHELVGRAQRAISPPRGDAPRPRTEHADRLVRSQSWTVRDSSPVRQELEEALARARAGGVDIDAEQLDRYAEAAHAVAEVDLAAVPTTNPADAVRRVVVGTLLIDPVLAALRRLAQEDVSAHLFGKRPARRTS